MNIYIISLVHMNSKSVKNINIGLSRDGAVYKR